MIDPILDNQIISYVTNNSGKIIPGRTNPKILNKLNYLNYIEQRYNDSESLSESLYRLVFNIEIRPTCKICGNHINYSSGKFSTYCSAKCRNNDPDVKEKNKLSVSKTLKDVYSKNKRSILEKRSNSLKHHYNIESSEIISTFDINEIKSKIKSSLIKNYGTDNYFKIKTYGKSNARKKSIELQKSRGLDIEYVDDKHIKVKNGCSIHGDIVIETGMFNNRAKLERLHTTVLCPLCNPKNEFTSLEMKITKFLDDYNIKYETHNRSLIKPYELDIFIPDKNIAIETNGIYWHSELFKDKNYHYNKWKACFDKSIQLIQIWEDDLNTKFDIICSTLKSKLGLIENKIYARKCTIEIPSNKQYKEFLNNNHIQGFVPSKFKYALVYNGNIVAVIGFGKLRKCLGQSNIENTYELYRYCTSIDCCVIGGFSKLLNYFIDHENPKHIISYAKCDYSIGNVYTKNNFQLTKLCGPNYYWIVNNKRENRFKFQKCKLDKLSDKSETEQMHDMGYLRCYDSGNLKFELNLL